jgi:hypothetical protein
VETAAIEREFVKPRQMCREGVAVTENIDAIEGVGGSGSSRNAGNVLQLSFMTSLEAWQQSFQAQKRWRQTSLS